jgi:hypothetical protein
MPVDAYGNPKAAAVGEMLGAMHRGMAVYSKQRKVSKGKLEATRLSFFVVMPGASSSLAPGIWRRAERTASKAVQAMLIFVKPTTYRKRFDLEAIGREKIKDMGPTFFAEFNKAMASAK